MTETFRILWILSLGVFLGSMLGRPSRGYWVTAVAGLLLILGMIGYQWSKARDRDLFSDEGRDAHRIRSKETRRG